MGPRPDLALFEYREHRNDDDDDTKSGAWPKMRWEVEYAYTVLSLLKA